MTQCFAIENEARSDNGIVATLSDHQEAITTAIIANSILRDPEAILREYSDHKAAGNRPLWTQSQTRGIWLGANSLYAGGAPYDIVDQLLRLIDLH